MPRLLVRTKRELLLFERLLKHLQHCYEGFHPDDTTAERSEVLLAMNGISAAPRECEVNESLLALRPRGSREPGYAESDVGVRAFERTFGHGASDDLRHRLVVVEQAGLDP